MQTVLWVEMTHSIHLDGRQFFFIEMGIALGGQVHHDSVTKDSRVVGVGWERGVGVGGGGQVG